VVDDQIGAPTGADMLADISAHLIRALASGAEGGTFHAAAAGQTSWHGYASHVVAYGRAAGLPIKVAPADIEPVPTSAFPTPARRPLNSRLATDLLRHRFGLVLPDWRLGVERMLAEVLER